MSPQEQAEYRASVERLSPVELARTLRTISQRAKADPTDAALADMLAILRERARVIADQSTDLADGQSTT